jgi:hypothetical protein
MNEIYRIKMLHMDKNGIEKLEWNESVVENRISIWGDGIVGGSAHIQFRTDTSQVQLAALFERMSKLLE